MSNEKQLHKRSNSQCELCASKENLTPYKLDLKHGNPSDRELLVCELCKNQIENPELMDANHWRCLNESMWSEIPAVQVVAWRMLNRLSKEGWPLELLEMLYLDEETLEWAKATGEGVSEEEVVRHIDSNGVILEAGDTVTLIKTLDVKGSTITVKRGAAVRNISLVADNPEHIEGRVEGQQLVILTKFVKKIK